jgi:hypothetical protein
LGIAQDAERDRQSEKAVVWFVWSIWFFWLLVERNAPDKHNEPDKPDQPVLLGLNGAG